MLRKFIYILVVFGFGISVAQESNQTIGIYGGYNHNINLANFQKIPDVPNCCPKFEYGYGSGFNLGILFEHKLSNSMVFSSRIEHNNFDAILKTLEPTQVIMNNSILSSGAYILTLETQSESITTTLMILK